ncbi:thrombomodulin [Alosa alosa]|uniref:thrombomodulin n=1 Tax=Alosa alosa TaxID=278164 RepID=UPI0020154A2C|nr:thrombomodulin [Alosa alosa]
MSKRSLSFSTMVTTMQVILTYTFLLDVESLTGFCVDNQCFSVHENIADFTAAKKVCQDLNGHLLTVRSSASSSAISTLLTDLKGDFWIGLQFNGNCPQSSDLKGYKWITGQEEAHFRNWDKDDAVCPTSEQCVTVSTDDLKWRERSCTDTVDGFICEFGFDSGCQPLLSDSQILTYRTPYGVEGPELSVLPFGSVAELNGGTHYICAENWQISPWTCEVLNGGCEQKCTRVNGKHLCNCSPGYLVDDRNGRSCRSDPCKGSGCEQSCIPHNGSFSCLCEQGFSLDADGKSCKDIDDCANERMCAGAHTMCVNTRGGFHCTCKTGFEMQKGFCVDIDECAKMPCEHVCINTPGSYNCSCYERHKVSDEDRHKCILHCPHQECPALCEKPTTETDGEKRLKNCICPDGYILDDNYFCVDKDECDMDYCDQHCHNTFGGYTCWCGEGYELVDGQECVSTEGSGFTTSYSVVTPTVKYTTESPSAVTAGGFLVIGVVCALLALCLLAFHCLKRTREYSLIGARKSTHMHDLEQITTENYKPHFNVLSPSQ